MSDSVRVSGPFFDGRAQAQVSQMMQELVRQTSNVGENQVHRGQGLAFRHPTGRYASSIRVQYLGSTSASITDGGMVYGPWLEGVGSRNRTTRFKGYHIMRTVTQLLNRSIVSNVIQQILPKYIARMNE
jgi:hypothetical protein